MNDIIWCRQGWYPIAYGFCPSEKAWNRQMKRLKCTNAPYPTGDGHTATFEPGNGGNAIILVTIAPHIDIKDPIGTVALIAHEAVHVWQLMCKLVADEDPSDETEAYAIQKILTELLECYRETRVNNAKQA